ncbi:MAG TPA: hypothetical protein VHM92_06535 [Allosphingosinicella sp.]|nr:hypothetical protein [Allosphingosinicella sp.]
MGRWPYSRLKVIVAGYLVSVTPAAVAAPPPSDLAQVPRRIVAEFARCVAKRHRREAADYVLRTISPSRGAAAQAQRKLADTRCLPAEATGHHRRTLLRMVEDDQLRPLLAEALVRDDFPIFDASVINSAQPLGYGKLTDELWPPGACKACKPAQLREFEQARARSSALLAPLMFGECVTRTDPANAHKVLLLDAGSPEESAVMKALRPALAHCVVPGGEVKIALKDLRKTLALNYYRLARAPRIPTAP